MPDDSTPERVTPWWNNSISVCASLLFQVALFCAGASIGLRLYSHIDYPELFAFGFGLLSALFLLWGAIIRFRSQQ